MWYVEVFFVLMLVICSLFLDVLGFGEFDYKFCDYKKEFFGSYFED